MGFWVLGVVLEVRLEDRWDGDGGMGWSRMERKRG